MRSSKYSLKRLICNNCGKRIYLPQISRIRFREKLQFPSYCPICGEQFSEELNKRLKERVRLELIILLVLIIPIFTIAFLVYINSL